LHKWRELYIGVGRVGMPSKSFSTYHSRYLKVRYPAILKINYSVWSIIEVGYNIEFK